jgi:hypothetical protein
MRTAYFGLRRGLLIAAISAIVIGGLVSPCALALTPHEDPETAKPVFSGIALFRYYSGSLDFVLAKDPATVDTRMTKMPFANVPESLQEATDDFASSTMNVAYLIADISENQTRLKTLVEQSRLDEAGQLANEISKSLMDTEGELRQMEGATRTAGSVFQVSLAPADSDLRQAYDEVLDRIEQIRQTLRLQETTSIEIGKILAGESLEHTKLSLKIEPSASFVGDQISFEGILTAQGVPLGGREIDVLLQGSQYASAITDASGHYQGQLNVPYWYVPQVKAQALYYPREKDIGIYLSSLSPEIELKVLFYEAKLDLTVPDKAYPRLETEVSGRFDYGQSPVPAQRRVQIYLDNSLAKELSSGGEFTERLAIDPQGDLGEHSITVSAQAVGRYSPVVATASLNVVRATPVLDLSMPRVGIIPGAIDFKGRLYSEVGPLSGAKLKVTLAKSEVELSTSPDGAFETKINAGMGFQLFGSQSLEVVVFPQEPWNANLVTTRSLVVVNIVNSSLMVVVLIFLGVYLPGRLRKRFGLKAPRKPTPVPERVKPEPTAMYSVTAAVPAEDIVEPSGGPRERILYWYRLVVRLIQRVIRVVPKPHETLREFAREASQTLGPMGEYLIQLTRIVERLLYSRYEPAKEDLEKGQELSRGIEGRLKGETR